MREAEIFGLQLKTYANLLRKNPEIYCIGGFDMNALGLAVRIVLLTITMTLFGGGPVYAGSEDWIGTWNLYTSTAHPQTLPKTLAITPGSLSVLASPVFHSEAVPRWQFLVLGGCRRS